MAWSCVPPGEGSSSYCRNTFKIRRQEKERETPGAMKTSSRSEKEPIKAYVRIINFGQSTTFLFCFTWLILKPATTKFAAISVLQPLFTIYQDLFEERLYAQKLENELK